MRIAAPKKQKQRVEAPSSTETTQGVAQTHHIQHVHHTRHVTAIQTPAQQSLVTDAFKHKRARSMGTPKTATRVSARKRRKHDHNETKEDGGKHVRGVCCRVTCAIVVRACV